MDTTTASASKPAPASARAYLSQAEIRELLTRSDLRGWAAVLTTWGLVAGAFALVAAWPNALTVVLALFVIGGRQLALGILMHDAIHGSLFRTPALNRFVGRWLCAYPIFQDSGEFRRYHLQHHNHTGTDADPDLPLARSFPVSRRSFARKILRDLTGITGVRFYAALLLMRAGLARYELNGTFVRCNTRGKRLRDIVSTALLNLAPGLSIQCAMVAALALFGHGHLYLLWLGAMLTTSMVALRIRAISEHAVVVDPVAPFLNARTVEAPWWQRCFFAPHNVNYHIEHHLLMSVPHQNLPRMHRMLKRRGALSGACIAGDYRDMIGQVTYPGA